MKITIHVIPDGSLDVHIDKDGKIESFDPTQLPQKMKDAMGDVTVVALERAAIAEAKYAAVDGETIEALKMENAAKDANIQALMARIEELTQGSAPGGV